MIFKLHYFFFTSGLNAIGLLLGVYMETYTDASATEIGMLYMMMPFIGLVFRPLICSLADRKQAHQQFLMWCLSVMALSYFPFVVIPFLGPQVYKKHARLCFNILVALKVVGDAAFGGAVSIGDSLAINYAKRIGTDFSVYRVWGTISWMFFGLVTGQINEVWFLPKYVPAFSILIISSMLNILLYYLWPKEYFRMVTHEEQATPEVTDEQKKGKNKLSAMTKSLLPREVVWAHAKRRLWLLVTLRCISNKHVDNRYEEEEKQEGAQNVEPSKGDTTSVTEGKVTKVQEEGIGKKVQFQILWLLIRRDPRIVLYLMFFVCAGSFVVPMSFLFISLSEICHKDNRCNFSQLAGLLQVSMAFAETILFIVIKGIIRKIGRLNTMAIAIALTCLKFTFYATIWTSVDPHFSLLIESVHGIIFGIFITLMVEMSHYFASEVKYIIPELVEREIVQKDSCQEKLELSLSATMQAIIASANDGIGRGVGALVYGLIVDHYNYDRLWLCIAISAAIVFCIIELINIIDLLFKFKVGLDQNQTKKPCKVLMSQQLSIINDGTKPIDCKNSVRNEINPYCVKSNNDCLTNI